MEGQDNDVTNQGYGVSAYTSEGYMAGERVEDFGYYAIGVGSFIVCLGIIAVLVGRKMKRDSLK